MHLLDLTEKNMNMNRQLNRMLCCRYGIHFTNFDRNFFFYIALVKIKIKFCECLTCEINTIYNYIKALDILYLFFF